VLLAAGSGTRFAGPGHKLLTTWRGRPLVTWALEAAFDAGLERTVVVTGAADLAAVVGPGVEVIANPAWAEGQATSLGVAIDWARREGMGAVVVGLGDQPMIPASAWRAVADADADVAVATYGGRRRNPVRLARSVWGLLERSGDEGARALMRHRPELVGEVACDGEPADIDTLEDLERWN